MSAAPPPPSEPAAEPNPDADGFALLEALRRKLDDQASLARKTQAQVSQLAESIGALVAEQRRRARWLNLNSFVAYAIFTLLVGAAFFVLYRSRASELVAARDRAEHQRALAVRRADEATAAAAAREQADARAWQVYQLLEAGDRPDAAAQLAALGSLPLSRTERAVLAARAHETQVMEVDAALARAAASFKGGRYGEVIQPLEAALVSEPSGARAASMHYYLGVAYAKASESSKAIDHLQAAIAGNVDRDDVRFQLASVLDRSGQYALARREYDRFATAHPQSPHAVFAMRRSATLARMPAKARAAGASGTATEPAAVGRPAGPGRRPAASTSSTPPAVAPPAPTVTPTARPAAATPSAPAAASPALAPTPSAPPAPVP